MPPFNVFRPFRASHRDRIEQAHDSRVSRYDAYEQSRGPVTTTRPGSRWRNVLTKRRPPRDDLYINGPEYSIASEPEVRRMVHPSRRTTVEDYDSQESMTTDSDNYPVRQPMPEPQTRFVERIPSHESFPREHSEHFMHRVPSNESFPPEPMPQPSLIQMPSEAPPFVAPPGEVYMEEHLPPSVHDERSAYQDEPPVIQAEPRRFRARRGEPITVGNMRIEVEDDGRHGSGYRSRRSDSGSTASYSSRSSRSYSSSSYDEHPIIISADPHTQIEIGNEEDGFVPYEQYLAEREERRRRRRRHHRDTPEEEVYVVPAGANVIFVDEDGRELHRVGEFDDRYSNRRRNTSARTTRQVLPGYDDLKGTRTPGNYTEQAVQTEEYGHASSQDTTIIDIDLPSEKLPQDESNLISQMHERMKEFMESRHSGRSTSPTQEALEDMRTPNPFEMIQLRRNRPASPPLRPPSPLLLQPFPMNSRTLRSSTYRLGRIPGR